MESKKVKKILINIIVILIIFILSIILSWIFNNYDLFFISKEDSGIKYVKNYKTINEKSEEDYISFEKEDNTIKLNYEGFVKKVIIVYATNSDLNVNIKYNQKDAYNNEGSIAILNVLCPKLNIAAVPINNNVKDLELQFDNLEFCEVREIIINNSFSFNIYICMFLFINIILIIVIYKYYKHNLFKGKIEYLFLCMALAIGTIIIILQPMTTRYSWDDEVHFAESYKILNFDGITEWTETANTLTMIDPFKNIDTIEERRAQNEYLNNSNQIVKEENGFPEIIYKKVVYILLGLFFKICSILRVPFMISFALAKYIMLLIYTLIVFWAIKIIPRGKRLLAFIGLLPTSMFMAPQFSYDPPITAGIALFIAVFLDVIENNRIVDLKTVLLLIIPMILASFIKAIYCPLILLILIIPSNRFEDKKQKNMLKLGTVFIFVLLLYTFMFSTVSSPEILGDLRGGNTSVSGQLNTIINNPIGYIKILKNNAGEMFLEKFIGMKTLYNYHHLTKINYNLYYSLLLILVFLICTDSHTENKNNYLKCFTLLLVLFIILLIWTALYLSFTPVAAMTINGVQNRYFIPLLFPILLICLSNNNIKHNFNMLKYETVIFLIVDLIYIYSIYQTFLRALCN